MECEHIREAFIERLTGTLDPDESAAMNHHLVTCAACRSETDRMQELWAELGTLRPPAATGGAERVRRLIEARGRTTSVSGIRSSRIALTAIGLAASLLLGLLLGRRFANDGAAVPVGQLAATPKERYVLLLHGPARDADIVGEQAIVAEYRAWATKLRAAGSLVSAEKLADAPATMLAATTATELPPNAPGEVGGFFLIQVADSAEAFRIARECPHLKHGGTVQVRRIQPT